jgi:hypothetical protein
VCAGSGEIKYWEIEGPFWRGVWRSRTPLRSNGKIAQFASCVYHSHRSRGPHDRRAGQWSLMWNMRQHGLCCDSRAQTCVLPGSCCVKLNCKNLCKLFATQRPSRQRQTLEWADGMFTFSLSIPSNIHLCVSSMDTGTHSGRAECLSENNAAAYPADRQPVETCVVL